MATKPRTHRPPGAGRTTYDRDYNRLRRSDPGSVTYQVNRWRGSKRWQNLRAVKLLRNPLCEECDKHDRTTPARQVHHIVPARIAPDRFWDWANLMSVCTPCHARLENNNGTRAAPRSG